MGDLTSTTRWLGANPKPMLGVSILENLLLGIKSLIKDIDR